MGENFVVAIRPDWPLSTIMRKYQEMGAVDIARLNNISGVLSQEIYVVVMPDGFPSDRMKFDGVWHVEGEVEHGFFQPHGFDPLPPNLQRDAPLGRSDLTLGSPSNLPTFVSAGSFRNIMEAIQAPKAWETSRGAGVTIVVIDTGVAGELVPEERRAGGWTEGQGDPWRDEVGHGSLAAMVAAANQQYNGYNGVAPDAKIFSMKPQLGPSGGILGSSVLKGLDHLLGLKLGPVVTNQSWGVYGCRSPIASCNVVAAMLVKEIQKGAITTWAAGNSKGTCGPEARGTLWWLNSMPQSVSVGALDRNLRPQFYSTPGPGQCFPLQPVAVTPTYGVLPWGGGFRDFGEQGGGTSSTSPMVAGALALLMSRYPEATNRELRNALRAGSSNLVLGSPLPYMPETGFGLLQIQTALALLPLIKLHPFYAVFP